jgi:ABC-type transporter Mla maintaining outer membrane lipid asymmetry permease subunit MlaE
MHTLLYFKGVHEIGQVGKGITAQVSHRTVRESLDSYGS